MRRLAWRLLTLAAIASGGATVLSGVQIALDPALTPWRDAAVDEIRAALDKQVARYATPARLETLVLTRLAESPRNWAAIDALVELAQEQGVPLPADTAAAVQAARDDDSGLLAAAGGCASCIWDASTCSITQVFLCRAPVDLTFVGDITGIARAGAAYATGAEIDRVDLALSVVGLGATAFVVATGGTSAVVKAGAGIAKVARGTGRLSKPLLRLADDAVRTGVDWARLPSVRSTDDLALAVRGEAFAPLISVAVDVERLRVATDATTVLHLLPLVDDANDARRLANAATAVGPKLVGRAELLGKARLMRTTVRYTRTAVAFGGGLIGLILSGGMMIAHAGQAFLFRRLQRAVAPPTP